MTMTNTLNTSTNAPVHEQLKIITTLIDNAWHYRDTDRNKSQEYATQAYELAVLNNYQQGVARSLVTIAFLEFREHLYNNALLNLKQAENILEAAEDKSWLPHLYNTMGITYSDLGDRALAGEYLFKQRQVAEQLGDLSMKAAAIHDMALLYIETEPQKAIEYLQQATKLAKEIDDSRLLNFCYNNLAYCHKNLGNTQQALIMAQATIALAEETQLRSLFIEMLCLLSYLYCEIQQDSKALNTLQHALVIARQEEPSSLFYIYTHMGNYYVQQNDLKKAISFYKQSLELSREEANNALMCNAALADCYAQLGEFEQAYQHQKQTSVLKDELFNHENEQRINKLEVLHKTHLVMQEAELERSKNQILDQKNRELQEYVERLERLNQQVRELSIRDELTGLYNRRYFMQQIKQHVRMAIRAEQHASILLLDVDRFKQINDTFGHHVGDDVLKALAQLFKSSMRDTDIIARYGGEEFVIILPATTAKDAMQVSEKLRQTIEQHDWSNIQEGLSLTISSGLVDTHEGDHHEILLNLADKRLYTAKHQGRNRTINK